MVWVNGAEAGSHKGGFLPFEMDISHLVRSGAETFTFTTEDDDPNCRIGIQGCENLPQFVPAGPVQGVGFIRPVDANLRNMRLYVDKKTCISHV